LAVCSAYSGCVCISLSMTEILFYSACLLTPFYSAGARKTMRIIVVFSWRPQIPVLPVCSLYVQHDTLNIASRLPVTKVLPHRHPRRHRVVSRRSTKTACSCRDNCIASFVISFTFLAIAPLVLMDENLMNSMVGANPLLPTLAASAQQTGYSFVKPLWWPDRLASIQ